MLEKVLYFLLPEIVVCSGQGLHRPAATQETGEASAWQSTDAQRDGPDESSSESNDDDDFKVGLCTSA